MEAQNNVVFDERGDVCVDACENCPFLHEIASVSECILRPEIIVVATLELPDLCPLRPGGLEVRLDFNRTELLAEGKRFREFPAVSKGKE